MNKLNTKIIRSDRCWPISLSRLVCSVIICASSFAFAQQSYPADPIKKRNKALNSNDLYVESQFDFSTFQSVKLDIYVTDESGNPAEGVLLKLSAIPADIVEITDPRMADASLLNIARTDEYGRVYREVEVSNSVEKLLLELNASAQVNKVVYPLDDSLHIAYTFVRD